MASVLAGVWGLAGCGATLPPAPNPAASAALLLTNSNANVVAGQPRVIYERLARQASRCWFGPFGSAHTRYMMHADVPPPASPKPVKIAIHRRLPDRKSPWGPALLRVELAGKGTTTLAYQSLGVAPAFKDRVAKTFDRWARGDRTCPPLDNAPPTHPTYDAATRRQPVQVGRSPR